MGARPILSCQPCAVRARSSIAREQAATCLNLAGSPPAIERAKASPKQREGFEKRDPTCWGFETEVPALAGMTPCENCHKSFDKLRMGPPSTALQTYPPIPQPALSSPRPPHRSEIMTSGWCGGDRVGGGSPSSRPKARRHDPVRRGRRCQRGAEPCRFRRGSGAALAKAAGRGVRAGTPLGRRASTPSGLAMRHGMHPGPSCHKPKIPAGRRGGSLFICGLPA